MSVPRSRRSIVNIITISPLTSTRRAIQKPINNLYDGVLRSSDENAPANW
jgi:hypothetical protein